MNIADKIISELKLEPHIEGGFFVETYKSPYLVDGKCINENIKGERPLSSTIYFLLKSGQVSKFHRLKFDEQWFFHSGSALLIHLIGRKGNLENVKLGPDIAGVETPQLLVKAGVVLGAEVIDQNSYCLVSCVVTPGFDYRDFTLFESKDLIDLFPQHEELIRKLNG